MITRRHPLLDPIRHHLHHKLKPNYCIRIESRNALSIESRTDPTTYISLDLHEDTLTIDWNDIDEDTLTTIHLTDPESITQLEHNLSHYLK